MYSACTVLSIVTAELKSFMERRYSTITANILLHIKHSSKQNSYFSERTDWLIPGNYLAV